MSRAVQDPFQRLLRWYPRRWRQANGEVFVGTLRDQAEHEHRAAPTAGDSLSAVVNGIGLRLDARVALWSALVAIGLGACSWLALLNGLGGAPWAANVVGIVTVGVVPALAVVAMIAVMRDRGWVTAPRALITILALVTSLALAALAKLSWAQGFRLADQNLPQTGLADAWGQLFVVAWVVGAAAIALLVDGLLHRTRWPWFARMPLAALVGILAAPAAGVALINPTMAVVVAGFAALMALSTLSGRRVRRSPAATRTREARSSDDRTAVRWLTGLSAIVGMFGVAYALTGAAWSAGAADGTVAMGQGITILLAAAIPLLTAVALTVSRRHGRAAVSGPIGLVILEVTAVAVAYVSAPAWDDMAPWMAVSAIFGGGAVAWWAIPRIRGPLGLRVAVGVALGVGYAVPFGTTTIPLLAFTVPVFAVVVALVGTRSSRKLIAPTAPDPTAALSA